MLTAYDTLRERRLPAETFRADIEGQLVRKYSLAPETNVLDWACNTGGSAAYRQMRRAVSATRRGQ